MKKIIVLITLAAFIGCKKEKSEPTQKVFIRAYSLQSSFSVAFVNEDHNTENFTDNIKTGNTYDKVITINKASAKFGNVLIENIDITPEEDSLYLEVISEGKRASSSRRFFGGKTSLTVQLIQLK